jgi:hypothetical protein
LKRISVSSFFYVFGPAKAAAFEQDTDQPCQLRKTLIVLASVPSRMVPGITSS